MCLTGVDYFSTLGYQPGIAFLAAGALAPIATLVLVCLTLLRRTARVQQGRRSQPGWSRQHFDAGRSPAAMARQGARARAARDLPRPTSSSPSRSPRPTPPSTSSITRSSHARFDHPIAVTIVLLGASRRRFPEGLQGSDRHCRGDRGRLSRVERLRHRVRRCMEIFRHPEYVPRWTNALYAQHGNPVMMLALALLVFPKLALGLSGFETGVAVMPLVAGDRVHNTRKLLRTAALIMSVLLIGSSIVTTLLIPAEAFAEGGEASGRALAYLAHHYLGELFGTIYDISTIAILWFAGASAMAGLLNLVPRYLPRYGMAPEWTRATRPLVTLFTAITFLITIIFNADVAAQGGAYATGVLVLMTSAAVAVTLALWRARQSHVGAFRHHHAGVRIHDSDERHRAARRREDRDMVHRDDRRDVTDLTRAALDGTTRAGRHRRSEGARTSSRKLRTPRYASSRTGRTPGCPSEYAHKLREAQESHHLPPNTRVLFVEVRPTDASAFSDVLKVEGADIGGHHVLRCASPAIPNAIAALLLFIRDQTRQSPARVLRLDRRQSHRLPA